jgi:hypothetical protein
MADSYVSVPIQTEPDDLAQLSFDFMTDKYPAWIPHDAQLDTAIIGAVAQQAAELRDVASDVSDSIYRYLGANLLNVMPLNAVPATVTGTINVKDNAGYTIPAGYTIGLRDSGGVLYGFQTTVDITIAAGATATTTGGVVFTAITPGVDSNGLGGVSAPAELITALDAVTSVTVTALSVGGQDDEDDEDYLNRLKADLKLQAPRPIIATDFAAFALNTAGVKRALALDGFDPAQYSTVTKTATSTSGSTTLTGLGANYTGITVGAQLVGPGIPQDTYVLSMNAPAGTLVMTKPASLNQANFSVLVNNGFGNARTVFVALADDSGNPVSAAIKADVAASLQAQREVNFIVNVGDPTYTTIDVQFWASAFPGWDPASVNAGIVAAIQAALNPATWGQPPGSQTANWFTESIVRVADIAGVISHVEGVQTITALPQLRIGANAYAATDILLPGAAPLPRSGAVSGVVV